MFYSCIPPQIKEEKKKEEKRKMKYINVIQKWKK